MTSTVVQGQALAAGDPHPPRGTDARLQCLPVLRGPANGCRLLRQQAELARIDRSAALGDLAARMAHRLRSPLSGVLVALTNLREESPSADHRERLALAIDALQRSFRELTVLVDEARLLPEPRRPFALARAVDELLALVRGQTEHQALVLANEVPRDLVLGLPEAGLRHALMSLLTNAVEAQRQVDQGRVAVAAEVLGEYIRIAITDHGPGFPRAELDNGGDGPGVWNRSGTGLGLAMVRRFAARLEGRLVLDNLPGGGALAVLLLPQETTHG